MLVAGIAVASAVVVVQVVAVSVLMLAVSGAVAPVLGLLVAVGRLLAQGLGRSPLAEHPLI